MGRKNRDKQILTLIRQCQSLAKTATTPQQETAQRVIRQLEQQYPQPHEVKQDVGRVIEQVFSEHGESVGAVVVSRYIVPLIDPRFSRRI